MAISKADFLRLILALLVAQVAVGFHAQRAAVLMPQPARDRRNVHAGLNATGGELQDAKSQIRVVAVFFIRRVLLAAIGAKLVLWIAVEFLAAALLAYRIVLAIE